MHKLSWYCISAILLTIFVNGSLSGQPISNEFGVYEYVIESARGGFEDVSGAIESAVSDSGYRLLAVYDTSAEGCDYRGRVFVLFDPQYAAQMMNANRRTAPFAVADRINLFEDENGIHVATVNPHSINRTVLMDDRSYEQLSETHLQSLRNMVSGAVEGVISRKQFGKKRDTGYISRTMGVMAGGKFDTRIEDLAIIPDGDWRKTAEMVHSGLDRTGPKWGLRLVYQVEMPEYETVVFGAGGAPMERKSYDIVKHGSDKSRKTFTCPGIAHAAAYPLEVVVVKENNDVKIRIVDAMYRMKMYFEDAGKRAFIKHLTMPGSIRSELKGQILPVLNRK